MKTILTRLWWAILLVFALSNAKVSAQVPEVPAEMVDSLWDLAHSQGRADDRASAFINLSVFFGHSAPDSCLKFARKALEMSRESGVDSLIATSLQNMGTSLTMMGDYDEALKVLYEAIEMYDKLDQSIMASRAEDSVGNLFYYLGDLEEAKVYYLRARERRLKEHRPLETAVSDLNLGILANKAGNQDEALAHYQNTIRISDSIHHMHLYGIANSNAARALVAKEDYAEARKYFDVALEVQKKQEANGSIAKVYAGIAEMFEFQDQMDSSIAYLFLALDYLQRDGRDAQVADLYNDLAHAYEVVGDVDQAIVYMKKYLTMQDSLFDAEAAENIAHYKVRYETDRLAREKVQALQEQKAAEEALLLEQQQGEIKNLRLVRNYYIIGGLLIAMVLMVVIFLVWRARTGLKERVKALELKQAILQAQMNPHFIFNALNSIQNQILNKSKLEAYEFHSRFSQLMRIVLAGSTRDTISLEEELSAIRYYLDLEQLRTDNAFTYSIHHDPQLDLRTMQVPPLLIQPFVENAIWHGIMNKESQGLIKVAVHARGKDLEYVILDDGVGRKRAREIREAQGGRHASLGMKVTEDRVNFYNLQHNRDLWLEVTDLYEKNGEAAGTKVTIRIPYN